MNGSGPRLALENRARSFRTEKDLLLSRLPELRAFADKHDLQMALDTSHIGTWDLDLLASVDYFKERLANVHLSDVVESTRRAENGRSAVRVRQHRLPGTGRLPLVEFLQLLALEGYRGPVTFELTPTALQIWNPWAVARILDDCVEFVRAAVRSEDFLDLYAST
jgi:sugar phosphate isomerase/epimerase